MALGKRRKEEEESNIDMTPMLDVVFIMLIFFIVTASFVNESGLDVNRPPTSDGPDPTACATRAARPPDGDSMPRPLVVHSQRWSLHSPSPLVRVEPSPNIHKQLMPLVSSLSPICCVDS